MNFQLLLLALCQGFLLTNNVTFIAINGLVGLSLAPYGWMATLPVMGYVVGGALSTPLVARTQQHFGRKVSFQMGLAVALASAVLCAYAAVTRDFWLLCMATVVAGYYNANANLYRFAAAELASNASIGMGLRVIRINGALPINIAVARAVTIKHGVASARDFICKAKAGRVSSAAHKGVHCLTNPTLTA